MNRFFSPLRRPVQHVRRTVIVTGTVVTAVLLALTISRPLALVQLDAMAYDLILGSLKMKPPPSQIAVVDIDERSIAKVGQWPWPRYHIARLIETIHSAGVKVV